MSLKRTAWIPAYYRGDDGRPVIGIGFKLMIIGNCPLSAIQVLQFTRGKVCSKVNNATCSYGNTNSIPPKMLNGQAG